MGGKPLTTDQFIRMAIRIHGNRYNYSRVYYVNMISEVHIICEEHGSFYQLPRVHLGGSDCAKCVGDKLSKIRSKGVDQFIQHAMCIHGGIYDYSKVKYKNNGTKVEIVCQKHGAFLQRPSDHINHKNGCPKCVNVGYSKISIKFLNDLAKEWKVEIQHAENGNEYRIEDLEFKCYYKADGYFEQNNKKYVVEFHGDYFHANPLIYKPDGICKLRRIRFDEIYNKIMERMHRIKALGYEVIYIWERDYKQYLYDKDNEFFFEGLLDYYKLL